MYGECGIVTIGFSFRWIEPDIDVMSILFVGERLDGTIEVYHRQRVSGALSRHVNRGERTPTHRRSVLMDLVVDIRRRDGTLFVLRPEEVTTSPLDVAGVDVDFGVDEMLSVIHEGRERRYDTEIDV